MSKAGDRPPEVDDVLAFYGEWKGKVEVFDGHALDALHHELIKEILQARGDRKYIAGFLPPWAQDVPEGLDPTFYGTGHADGDRKVAATVAEIQKRIATDFCGEHQPKEPSDE